MDSMHRIEDFGNLPEAIDNNVFSCNRYVNICTFSRKQSIQVFNFMIKNKSNTSWKGEFINVSIIISACINDYQGLAPLSSI